MLPRCSTGRASCSPAGSSTAAPCTRYKGNFNVRLDGLDVGRLMSDVREVMFSAGSACASESGKPSRILAAIGLTPSEARGSIRLGFGRYTTLAELEQAAGMVNACCSAARIASHSRQLRCT